MIRLKSKHYPPSDIILYIVFFAMLGDYLLTFWGMQTLHYIEEFNPLMVSFMELPLYKGLLVRVGYTAILLLVIRFGLSRMPNQSSCNKILAILLGIQVIPYIMHGIWLSKYFTT
jgi:hypothetical protein